MPLIERFDQAIMLDGDYICRVHPFELGNAAQRSYLFATLEHLVRFHQHNGYTNFVINYVFENTDELAELIALLDPLEPQIHCFWLTCTEAEQAERIRKRGNGQVAWELKRFKELNAIQGRASREGFIGERVRTEGQSVQKVVAQIWKKIGFK
ncbi:MAG: hypothetical protein AAF798_21080 [Bacteroidota bacterium]